MQSLPCFPRSDDADDDGRDFFSGDIRNRHGWFGPAEVVLAQELVPTGLTIYVTATSFFNTLQYNIVICLFIYLIQLTRSTTT
jgi:hypothetical protein